ncbi:MAG: hypothetical protein GF375_00470 [Candidatus Omnitrophica bacterium]|nr:hypothetical protein [Candidatus Omnitrophota bacterium]
MNEIIIEIKEAVFAPNNATASISGFDTGVNLLGVVLAVGLAAAMLLILTYISSSFERFKRFTRLIKILRSIGKTLNYAAYGGLTVVLIVGPVMLLYYGVTTAAENSEALAPVAKWVFMIVGIYALLVIVGFIAKKKIWRKLFNYRKRLRSESYAENFKQLPGVFK